MSALMNTMPYALAEKQTGFGDGRMVTVTFQLETALAYLEVARTFYEIGDADATSRNCDYARAALETARQSLDQMPTLNRDVRVKIDALLMRLDSEIGTLQNQSAEPCRSLRSRLS